MTFTCLVCNEPRPVEEAKIGDDGMATVCVGCYKHQLQTRFTQICPHEYQRTDTRSPLFPDIAKRRLPEVMDWKYGNTGLILYGRNSGEGKSRCAWLLIQRLMCMDGIDVTVFDSIGFAEELERRYHNDDDVRGWLKSVTEAPVVFFDDFAKFKLTERVAAELYAVVDRRVHNGLPILVTLNESGDELEKRDKRFPYLVRRLRQFSQVVEF